MINMYKSLSPGIENQHQVWEEDFLAAATKLDRDPMFGVPGDVRDVIALHGDHVRLFILGTKGLGSHLVEAVRLGHYEAVAAVDDTCCGSDERYAGLLPIISTEAFVSLAKQGGAIAVNTCGFDRPKRYFDEICRASGIPHLNYEQAVRAFRIQGEVDYRMDDWGPSIVRNVDRYQALARRFDDAYSVQTLYAILSFQLTGDPEHIHEVERPYSTLYFRSGLFRLGAAEKMEDCGASVGESLTGLIGITKGEFARSWMIEPDRFNVQTLRNLMERYKGTPLATRISLHDCAAGETRARIPFTHEGGHGGCVVLADDRDSESDLVSVLPVDEIIDDAPTFIKMDIEGSELPALKGARKSILEHAPKLAISAYHRSTDLLDLTDYVLGLNPEYKIGLRHHTSSRWDTCLYFY
jgi:FkbM family methyltransferase